MNTTAVSAYLPDRCQASYGIQPHEHEHEHELRALAGRLPALDASKLVRLLRLRVELLLAAAREDQAKIAHPC